MLISNFLPSATKIHSISSIAPVTVFNSKCTYLYLLFIYLLYTRKPIQGRFNYSPALFILKHYPSIYKNFEYF